MATSVSGRLLFAGYDDFECKVGKSAHATWIGANTISRFGMLLVGRRLAHWLATATVSAVWVLATMA